jgi:hypothetical protein
MYHAVTWFAKTQEIGILADHKPIKGTFLK